MQNASTPPITNPEERNAGKSGFTHPAEIWNSRLAMIGFVAALLTELFTNQGVLHFCGLL